MSSSKGLGAFANRNRNQFREINQTGDIFGAQASTLKKGPMTKRTTNPLNPSYVTPGEIEYAGTTKHALDGIGMNENPKPPRQPLKPPEKAKKAKVEFQPNLDKNQISKDAVHFYGTTGRGPEIDVNKLYKASKSGIAGAAPGVPNETANSKDFQYN